jgi:hypothetical protein
MRIQTFGRMALALCAPFLLFGCILTPGKFASTLSIGADRSFTFTYKGEVIALDMSDGLKDTGTGSTEETTDPSESSEIEPQPSLFRPIGWQSEDKTDGASSKEDTERKNRAIAEALSKEAGYRSVQYLGEGKFMVDYAITGTLDHNFVYPYNLDAEIMFPFIAIELRANGAVRMKAPAFGNDRSSADKSSMGMGGEDKAAKLREGSFTLDTDAEIISQNNEDGVQVVNGRKTIVWKVTPLSQASPTAVLKMRK